MFAASVEAFWSMRTLVMHSQARRIAPAAGGVALALVLLGIPDVVPAGAQQAPRAPQHMDGGPTRTAALTPNDDVAVDLSAVQRQYARPDSIPFPEDNPYSEAKSRLGKMLFFDPRLSGSNLLSCASCHNPSFAWEDGQPTGTGHGMVRLGRHTPTILNLAWSEIFFWDGRADTLEAQALGPIQADVEMNQAMDDLIAELQKISGYQAAFEAAFPGEGITPDGIAKAIATYERTVVSNKAPFDLWIEGDESAISESAARGFVLFNTKANCVACHSGWNFTDDSFHDIGLFTADAGRAEVIDVPELRHAFKTPGLRNIVERAPYMHNGSLASLHDVIDHYASGFIQRSTLSDDIVPLTLTARDKEDLVAFLQTLSSDDDPVTIPALPN